MSQPEAGTAPSRRSAAEITLLAVLIICVALVFLNRGGIAFLFPTLQPQLQLTNTQLGQLMSVTALSWAISSVCCSLASDILGVRPRTLIVICALGFSVVGGLAGAVSSFPALLALRAAMGVFEGPVIPLVQATVAAVSPPERRGANLGLVIGLSGMIGSMVGPALMTGMADTVGWRFAFLALALPGPFVALAIWFVMRPRAVAATAVKVERLDFRAVLRLGAQRNIFLGAIGAITTIGSAIALGTFLPLYLASLPSFSTGERVAFFVGLGIFAHIGGIVVSALSDRFGRRPCLIAACLCAVLASGAVAMMSVSAWWVVPALLLSFVAAGALTLMVYVIPGETVPPGMVASTYAVLLFVGEMVGGTAAPTLAGWIVDQYGLVAVQGVCGALAAIGLLAALFVREPAPKRSTVSYAMSR
ncbi:MFS transporter [Niveispirillum sp. KHB5.9]|uniref:MFS transporter n=1 Tax=Niveispirillum sp. KHB5.9 TaxID=3400269 RepID=UPI003A87CD38